MILYFTASFLLEYKESLKLKINNQREFLKLLLDINLHRNLPKIFKKTLFLYNKYKKSQNFYMEPYQPGTTCDYPNICALPLKQVKAIEKINKEIHSDDFSVDISRQIMVKGDYKTVLEQKFKTLLNNERDIDLCKERILENEKRKTDVLRFELGMLAHQKGDVASRIGTCVKTYKIKQ